MINRLLTYKEKLSELKTFFDTSQSEDELEVEMKRDINAIYAEVKDICRIVNAYYEFDPLQHDKFKFYHVMINLKKSSLKPA